MGAIFISSLAPFSPKFIEKIKEKIKQKIGKLPSYGEELLRKFQSESSSGEKITNLIIKESIILKKKPYRKVFVF